MKRSKPTRSRTATDERAPPYLSADAAELWRQTVTYLRGNGTFLAVDAGVVETYVTAVVRLRRLTLALDKAALVDKEGKPHPLLRTVEATCATVKNLAHVLGLSPLARKALPAKPRVKPNSGGRDVWRGVLDR